MRQIVKLLGISSIYRDFCLRQRSSSPVVFWAIFFLVFPAASIAEDCYPGFATVKLSLLQRPIFEGEKEFCGPVLGDKARERGVSFLRPNFLAEAPPGTSPIVEVVSGLKRTVHLLREGVYFGEFIEQELTEIGGHKQDVFLLITKPPRALKEVSEIGEISFTSGLTEYIWSELRVVKTITRYRPVKLKVGGGVDVLEPEWNTHTLNWRLVQLALNLDPRLRPETKLSPVQLESYFFDPLIGKERIFRRFPLLQQKLPTVIPFLEGASPDSSGGYATIKILHPSKEPQKVKLNDPKEDNVEVLVRISS